MRGTASSPSGPPASRTSQAWHVLMQREGQENQGTRKQSPYVQKAAEPPRPPGSEPLGWGLSLRPRSRRQLPGHTQPSVVTTGFQLITPHPPATPSLALRAFVWVKILGRPGMGLINPGRPGSLDTFTEYPGPNLSTPG